jgi:hypothetical protein
MRDVHRDRKRHKLKLSLRTKMEELVITDRQSRVTSESNDIENFDRCYRSDSLLAPPLLLAPIAIE